MSNLLKISKEKRELMVSEIQAYFLRERDEELGTMAAGFVLDFFIEKLAPEFYNQGVGDAYTYLNDKLEDLFSLQR